MSTSWSVAADLNPVPATVPSHFSGYHIQHMPHSARSNCCCQVAKAQILLDLKHSRLFTMEQPTHVVCWSLTCAPAAGAAGSASGGVSSAGTLLLKHATKVSLAFTQNISQVEGLNSGSTLSFFRVPIHILQSPPGPTLCSLCGMCQVALPCK